MTAPADRYASAAAATPARHSRRHRPGWRQRFGHSLKARLVLLFLLLALGTTGLFFAGTRALFSTGWRELARPLITDYVDRLAVEIGSPPDLARAQALVRRLPVSIRIDGPSLQWQSHPQRAEHGPRDPALRAMLSRDTADGHHLVFGISAWRWDDHPGGFGWGLLAGLLAMTALAYAYVRRMFWPLDDIRAGALRFGGGDFATPIPQRRRDELGDLAGQVNTMASRLQQMLEGQRGLLLAISHELRSPLTRARLHAELLTEGSQRDALLRDLGQMRDLVTDLLESERLAAGNAALQQEPTDLNALVHDLVAQQFDARKIKLALDPALPVLALDRVRLALLVRNLLDNALRHGGAAPVTLSTTCSGPEVVLSVRDEGPGVDEVQLDQLGQAFYRPDAARTRAAGGVGLGLYLCRLVAESHGGRLVFANARPGLVVSLHLPAGGGTPAG